MESEYEPSSDYLATLRELILYVAPQVAALCATLGERLLQEVGPRLVLVSIARAGTPVGVVVKRWLSRRHGLEVPHYSISVADREVDLNAIRWLCEYHDPRMIQFLDGWTSKGTVQSQLNVAAHRLGIDGLDPSLAVLADPGWAVRRFATRSDVLLPAACLGSTICGLLSATTRDLEMIGVSRFHGAAFYRHLREADLTGFFIEETVARFEEVENQIRPSISPAFPGPPPDLRGSRHAKQLARRHRAPDLHLVTVGASETTRTFFRRTPRLLLINSTYPDSRLEPLLRLAQERGVAVREEETMPFQAAAV